MNIITCLFSTESNTFNPILTTKKDFNTYFEEDMFDVTYGYRVFEKEGYNIIPTFSSSALPGGKVKEEDYLYFKTLLIEKIKEVDKVDGVWLHLHGAMEVNNIGSGELDLVRDVRKLVGEEAVIGVVFDIHANHSMEIINYIDVSTGYKTIPHHDQKECEIRVAKNMVKLLQDNRKVTSSMSIVPMIVSGEKATDGQKPVEKVLEYVSELTNDPKILDASVYLGCPWADVPTGNFSVIVTPSNIEYKEYSDLQCKKISEYLVNKKEEFEFISDVLSPEESLEWAFNQKESPVFITDSGDNTTGGAVGGSTELLNVVLNKMYQTEKRIVIGPIYDVKNSEILNGIRTGKYVDLEIGNDEMEYDKPVNVSGLYYAKGNVMGFLNDPDKVLGSTYLIRKNNVDIIISDKPTSLISPRHFEEAHSPIKDYGICIVKQGYLFSDLIRISKKSVMASTKGATYQYLENLDFKNIERPMYPFDEISTQDIKYNF